jgi:hypothetical protein
MELNSISIVKKAHNDLVRMLQESGDKMPENKGANRKLDCAVIRYVHESFKKAGAHAYDSVHNPSMIKGYFLPRPVDVFNPYLN